MAKFKKGDVCIVLWSENFPELVGEEVVLTSDQTVGYDEVGSEYLGFETGLGKSFNSYYGEFHPTEEQLKLKPFKGEQSVMEMFKGIKLNNVVDKQREVERS